MAEEYLESIYRLQEKLGVARTSDLVKLLQVVPGTVTKTVDRLEKEGFITHVPYKGVRLTETGQKIALQALRRHRLSERLLTDILHLDWDSVHDAACKIEHVIDDVVIKKLDKILGYPKTCPHGNPIPTKRGEIFEEESHPLDTLNERERGKVVKITEEKSDLLRYFDSIGLVPGAAIEIVEKAPFDGPITVRVGKTTYAVGRAAAAFIRVKREQFRKAGYPMKKRNPTRVIPLTALNDGQTGILTSVKASHGRGQGRGWGFEKRLEDMGLTPGTRVKVVKSALFHGPLEILVRGSRLALGRGMAEKIFVEIEK